MSRLPKIIFGIIALVAFGYSMYSRMGTDAGNRLVEEANALVLEGNNFSEQAGTKFTAIYSDENLEAFPGNRAELQPLVTEASTLLSQGSARYRSASAKFLEASTKPADKVIGSYWTKESESLTKLADAKDELRKLVELISDPAIESVEVLHEKGAPILVSMQQAMASFQSIAAEALKIQTDNASKFE